MPELPEMETYRRLLLPRMAGRIVRGVTITREKSVNLPSSEMERILVGRPVTDISRRAKHLLFHVGNGHVLLLHLMLGGWMFWGTPDQKPDRTVQVELSFGPEKLYFIGLRLGYLHLYETQEAEKLLEKLGPDPLAPGFGERILMDALKGKKGALKAALTDQSVLSGIGGCYSDEICFAAGIRPDRRIDSLHPTEGTGLYQAMNAVLNEAVAYGGYMDTPLFAGDTATGGYGPRCRVYDREGEPCFRCGSPIVRRDIASRKSYSCPVCQG